MIVQFSTFSKRLNSTARPSGGTSYNCSLKSESGKKQPYLEIATTNNPTAYNYAYIPAYGRYYYITDWIYEGGRWAAYLSVDVLASFKTEIGSTSLYILRSSVQYDNRVLDEYYPVIEGVNEEVEEITSTPFTSDLSRGTYVVGVISKAATNGAVAYYVLSYSQMASLRNFMMNQNALPAWNADWNAAFPQLTGEALKTLINPFQYIASCMWLPFEMWSGGSAAMPFGYYDSGLSFPVLATSIYTWATQISVPDNFRDTPEQWRRLPPYATYQLIFPPFGCIDLDGSYLASDPEISLQIFCDPISGTAKLIVWGSATRHVYACISAQMGVSVQLAQLATDVFNAASTTANTYGGIIKGALGGDLIGAITGAVTGVGDIAKASMPTLSTTGGNGGSGACAGPKRLIAQFRNIPETDNDTFGRPFCKIATPASLGGFMIAKRGDKVRCAGSDEEKEQIKNYIEGGFYYE